MPYTLLDPATAEIVDGGSLGAPLTDEGMTLADLRGALNLALGNRTDVGNPQLDRWINYSYLDMASSLEVDDLKGGLPLNTVVGQALYLLPKSIAAIRKISVIDPVTYGELNGRELTPTDLNAYRRSPARTDEPTEFFRDNRLLVLYPTPATVRVLSLDVWIRPSKLVADSDSPILSEEWHEVLVKNATAKAYEDLREFGDAAPAINSFIGLVRRKEDREATEDDSRVVGSSVPRSRKDLYRRHRRQDDIDGLR
jgi:hypothetical protein